MDRPGAGIGKHDLLAGGWAALGLGSIAVALAVDPRLPPIPALVILTLLSLAAEHESVPIGRSVRETISLSLILIVTAGLVCGPLGAGLVGAAAMIGDGAPPWSRRIAFTGIQATMGTAAGAAAYAVAGSDAPAGRLVLAALAATAAAVLTNLVALASIDLTFHGTLRRGRRRTLEAVLVAGSFAWLPVPIATVMAYRAFGPLALLLAASPLPVAALLKVLQADRDRLGERLLSEQAGSALALVRTLDARDRYTAQHSAAVAVYAGDLAERLGLDADATRRLRLAGLVHDIGKMSVPAEVLQKAGALTDEEWRIMRLHPVVGESILSDVPGAHAILDAVRHHHERPDGRGYPDGLRADDIPRDAAIIAVVDAYSAMTHDRTYREALEPEDAIAELRGGAGTQWRADVARAFSCLLEEASEEYRHACGARFDFDAVAASLRAGSRTNGFRPQAHPVAS